MNGLFDALKCFWDRFLDQFINPKLIRPENHSPIDELADTDLSAGASVKKDLITIKVGASETLRLSGFGQNIAPAAGSLADAFKNVKWRIFVNNTKAAEYVRFQVGDLSGLTEIFIVVDGGSQVRLEVENTDTVNAMTVGARLVGWTF